VLVSPRKLLAFLAPWLSIAVPAHAKNHDTGFLDRTIALQGATYKYQVFVPRIGHLIKNGRSYFSFTVPVNAATTACNRPTWALARPSEAIAAASRQS